MYESGETRQYAMICGGGVRHATGRTTAYDCIREIAHATRERSMTLLLRLVLC